MFVIGIVVVPTYYNLNKLKHKLADTTMALCRKVTKVTKAIILPMLIQAE